MATEVLNLKFQLVLSSLGSSLGGFVSRESSLKNFVGTVYLKSEMLEEVRGAAGLVGLGSRTGVNPDTDS